MTTTSFAGGCVFDRLVPPILDTQYWGYCYMKYSYEYKRKCVEMYREGKWPETPEGIQERNFHEIIRKWFRIEESCGPDALRHKMQNKVWTVEEKYELVAKVLAGASYKETAISSGIEDSLIALWKHFLED